MGNKISRYVICMIALILLMSVKSTANASGEYLDNNKNSVVQVIMTYTAADGKRLVLQSGSGVVINSNTVLTNYHLVHMNEKNLKKAKDYIVKNGGSADFSGEEGMQIAIVKKDDVLIYAGIAQESEEKDFAILSLEEETDCPPAVLGNSDVIVVAENVMAVGYPSTKPFSKEGAKLFKNTDVNLVAGVVSEVEPQNIKVSGIISSGNSGGALINGNTGEVLGILTYDKEDGKKECFRVIPINEIKFPYLEGITYSDNSVAATEEVTEEVTTEILIDKSALSECIDKALKLDQSLYKSDSYLILMSCLQQAQQVQYDEQATQAEIDDAKKILQQSMDNLEMVEKTNWVLIIGIIVGIAVVVAAIVIMIIILCKTNKQKKENNKFTSISNSEIPNFNQMGYPVRQQTTATQEDINRETTLLNMAGVHENTNNNATTILNAAPPQIQAYLIRKKTGEKRLIDTVEFTVGKDETKVNYFVSGNDTISRCHMRIIKKGMQYYLMDLGSTNYTYLNNEQIPANQERAIKSGDYIKAADEEFIFEII